MRLPEKNKVLEIAVYGYCLTFALSIAISKIFLGAVIGLWIWDKFPQRKNISLDPFAVTLSFWFLACLASSLFGLNPERSIEETFKMLAFLFTPFAVAPFFMYGADDPQHNSSSAFVFKRICLALSFFFVGQTIAAVHTLFKEGFASDLPQIIPGALTESGQIVVVAPFIAMFLISRNLRARQKLFQIFGKRVTALPLTYFAAISALNIVSIWPTIICRGPFSEYAFPVSVAALCASLSLVLLPFIYNRSIKRSLPLAIWACAAFVFSALIINLKRGPWLGVIAELLIIGFLFSSKLVRWTLGLALLSIVLLDPVRSRVNSLVDHFTISGGRQEMWGIGSELVQRFPLGVGYQNARVIRDIDPAIPPTHRHLHNNLLNVAVEVGWIGLTIYLLWMYQIIKMGITSWRRVRGSAYSYTSKRIGQLGIFLAISIFGWQLAGMVEYNFGDGEIRMLAMFMMGIVIAVERETLRVQKLAKVVRFKERKVA